MEESRSTTAHDTRYLADQIMEIRVMPPVLAAGTEDKRAHTQVMIRLAERYATVVCSCGMIQEYERRDLP